MLCIRRSRELQAIILDRFVRSSIFVVRGPSLLFPSFLPCMSPRHLGRPGCLPLLRCFLTQWPPDKKSTSRGVACFRFLFWRVRTLEDWGRRFWDLGRHRSVWAHAHIWHLGPGPWAMQVCLCWKCGVEPFPTKRGRGHCSFGRLLLTTPVLHSYTHMRDHGIV